MLFEYINEYDSICIFHHERADFDALGSAFALKEYIEVYYQKTVYIIGNDAEAIAHHFPYISEVSDEIIQNSLAIIVDTANKARIDDDRTELAQFRIKIDHHLNVDQYADYEIVDEKAAATCEILAKLFFENQKPLPKQCANYLYLGLVSDTISFTTTNTSANTLMYASYVAESVDSISEIAQLVFDKSINEFKYESYLKNNIQFDQDVAYVIIEDEYLKFGVNRQCAKEMVYIMSNIQGINKWALFIKMKNGYGVSLRSKKVPIEPLAREYGGGGHINASGIKDVPFELIDEIVEKLKKL